MSCQALLKGAYLNNGIVRPCCWYDRKGLTTKAENLIEVKQVFDQGPWEYGPACWKCDRHGGHSHREKWNARFSGDDRSLKMLDIYLGNLCNIACIMCSSNNSTKWIEEEKKLFGSAFRAYQDDIDLTVDYELVKDLERIKLAGGEPLIIPGVVQLMERLIELDVAKNITLSIITNNTQDPRKFAKYFEQFKSVEFICSVEGVGDVNDYVRYGSNWNMVDTNIQRAKDLGILCSINCVVSILNVYHLPDMAEWWDGVISYRILDYPSHLSISSLTLDERAIVLARLNGYPEFDHISQAIIEAPYEGRFKFEGWIDKVDGNRGNSFWGINPHMSRIRLS